MSHHCLGSYRIYHPTSNTCLHAPEAINRQLQILFQLSEDDVKRDSSCGSTLQFANVCHTFRVALRYADFVVAMWGNDFEPGLHAEIVAKAAEEQFQPTVDVFLPVCNERIVVLNNAWKYVAEIDYPYFAVHVLDDGGNDDVRDLAAEYGFFCECDGAVLLISNVYS